MVDIRTLARLSIILIAIATILIIKPGKAVWAQYGACPSYSIPILPNPIGIFRSDMSLCRLGSTSSYELQTTNGLPAYESYPCDGQFILRPTQYISNYFEHTRVLQIVPPYYQYLGSRARIRFLLFNASYHFGGGVTFDPFLISSDDPVLHVQSGNPDTGQLLDYTYTIEYMPMVLGFHDGVVGVPGNGDWWYQVYLVDVGIDTWADYGGFFNVYVEWRENTGTHNPWGMAYGIGSIQVGNENEPFPAHCAVPGAVLPQTPTPTPTGTIAPTPTGTRIPTRTPDPSSPTPTRHTTPFPTAPGGTPLPTRTLIPPVINTIPAEATPSPYPNPNLDPLIFPTIHSGGGVSATVSIPTIAWPTIEAANVPEFPTPGEGPDWTGLIGLLDSDWISDTGAIASSLDPALTDTTVISSPNEIAAVVASSVGTPVAYFKLIPFYMPNTWPYIFTGFLFVVFMIFNIIAKFVLNNLGKILDIIRRIIEIIPGF